MQVCIFYQIGAWYVIIDILTNMTSRVERAIPIAETRIGVFCDNHPGQNSVEIGRVLTPFFPATRKVIEGPSVDRLRLLEEHHLKNSPICKGFISYVGNVGSYPVQFTRPK